MKIDPIVNVSVPGRRLARLLLSGTMLLALVVASACSPGSAGNGGPDGGGDDDDDDIMYDAGPDGPPSNQDCANGGFGAWTGHDNLPASQSPPCGILAKDAPMWVSVGFDDNGDANGMTWALDMLKDRGLHTSFYMTSTYGSSTAVTETWKRAKQEGHEIGNHTVSHLPNHGGRKFSLTQWHDEIAPATEFLTGTAGVAKVEDIIGFRTPYLEYNDATLATVADLGFWYDNSIEESYEDDQDGSNAYWPYTLDNRSPGHSAQVAWMDPPEDPLKEIEPHPGLWEMPTYAFFVPPDAKCAQYGVPSGFRARLHAKVDWFDVESGSITGFDYNLWAPSANDAGGFDMTKAEFLAVLKYTFDQRAAGNHAPMLFGAHTAYYVDAWSANAPGAPNASDRQAAMEEFLDYVKSKGGKVASHKEILDWIRNPK